ncbi:hypothetical protein [Adhaeretor mobilis]|nr:hypothetical protein [Adhaeretor mobilis]
MAVTTCLIAAAVAGHPLRESWHRLVGIVWGVLVVLWILADSKLRKRTLFYDYGFLALLLFPVSLLWYCFSTRGWRGGFMIGLVLALWVAPYLIADLVWQYRWR